MQMLYNSDSYAVVQFDVPPPGGDRRAGDAAAATPNQASLGDTPGGQGGYEIVDKLARKEIYLRGALADSFRRGVQALVDAGPTEEALDDYIAGYTLLAQQPLVLH